MASAPALASDEPTAERFDIFVNPTRRAPEETVASDGDPLLVHQKLPGYAPTDLVELPDIAEQLGVSSVIAKVESSRFGLPAFKLLGASWATYRALVRELGEEPEWSTVEDLRSTLEPLGALVLTTATDGNHGRAVARMAEMLGLGARIFVPSDMAEARRLAIASHGAEITIVDGDYDDAVRASARFAETTTAASPRALIISDTSWPGYSLPPRDVIAGYSTMFGEIDQQLGDARLPTPTHWFVPAGVGALLAAAISAVWDGDATEPRSQIVCVEPVDADCLLESARAGYPTTVPGPHTSQMVGLNCGSPSPEAWPSISAGTDVFLAVPDTLCESAVRLLAANGVNAGETGSAALAGALAAASRFRDEVGVDAESVLGLIVTEGVTDPQNWARITGLEPPPMA
jgi:diaminopropionate ammonia-lyase